MAVEGLKKVYGIPFVKGKVEVLKRNKKREERRPGKEREEETKERGNKRRLDIRA
jgi:hypothetical protein